MTVSPNIIEGYSTDHQVVGMSGATVFRQQMHEYHHRAVQRCFLPVQQWAAGVVPLNWSGLTGFHEVTARQVAVLLTLSAEADLVQHGLPILQNAQYHY